MANGGDIIIKGSSVDLNYDEGVYPKDSNDGKKHKNQNMKVTRVLITGDIDFDSGEHPNGLRCEITTFCK
jgi:hypothetical protein